MFRKMLFVLLLMVVAVASACTGKDVGPYSQTEGLVITKFASLPAAIYNDEQVTLVLEVLNKGGPGVVARNVQAFVLNTDLGGWNIGASQTATINVSGRTTPVLAWNPGDVYGASKDGTLKAIPDSTSWSLTAGPNTARTLDVTYNPKVRLCYEYQTEATTKAKAVNLDYLRSQQQRGEVTQTDITTQNSGGPIQMQITTRQPIILRDNDQGRLKLTVDVLNVNPQAGGLPFIPKTDASCLNPDDMKNKVLVAVEVIGANCSASVGQLNIDNARRDNQISESLYQFYRQNNVPQTACLGYVTLSDGKRGVANYEFGLSDAVVGEKELTVRLTAFYGYYTEADTRFTVSPLPQ